MQQKLYIFNKDLIIKSLILSLPVLAVFSIFFLELALIIITSMFFFEWTNNKEKKYINKFFFKFFIVFYFYILINFLLQDEKFKTLSIIFYFRYGLYIISIYYFLANDKKVAFNFLKVVFFTILILCFDGIFQSFFKVNLFGYKIIEEFRVSSFFGDELILGSFIFRMLPFIFIYLLINENKKKNLLISFTIPLSLLLIFLSGERISIFLSVLLVIFYLLVLYKEEKLKKLKIFFVIGLLLISLVLFFSKNYKNRFISQSINDFSINYIVTQHLLEGYNKKDLKFIFFSGLHHNLAITSIEIFKDNIFFGSGPRSFRDVCGKYKMNVYSCDTHPHNFYLQILSETGLIGLFFLASLYFFIIFKILKLRKVESLKSKLKIIILGYYALVFIPGFPSGNFFNNWLSILIFLPLAFYFFIDETNFIENGS